MKLSSTPHWLPAFVFAVCALLACARPSHKEQREGRALPAQIGYGTAMADVARRFELFGRAATAARFELAAYQLEEIAEQFEETLPHAAPPREGHPEVLPELAAAFLQRSIPDLRRALAAHDQSQLAAAFERAATACNGCHQASGHAFIEVPAAAGQSIPNTAPVP